MTITSPDFAEPPSGAFTARPPLDESRSLLRLAAPIMFICLVTMGMSVTDTVILSALFGAEALAAAAVGSDLYSILFYLGAGVLVGFAPLYMAAVSAAIGTCSCASSAAAASRWPSFAALLVPLVWTAHDWLAHLGLSCCRWGRATRAPWPRRSCRCSTSPSTARS